MDYKKQQQACIYYHIRAKNRQFTNLQNALYKCQMMYHKISRMVIIKEKERRRQIYDYNDKSQYQGNQITILFNNTQATQLEMEDIASELELLNLPGIASIFKSITKILYGVSDDFTNIFKQLIQRSKQQYSWKYSTNLCGKCARNIQKELLEQMKNNTTIATINHQQISNQIIAQYQFNDYQQDQLFMVQKQYFLSQIDQILRNKNYLLNQSHTKTYKFLMKNILENKKSIITNNQNLNQNQLSNISLKKLEIISSTNKSYESIIELLKIQLFKQFLENLSGPFRALLENAHNRQIQNTNIIQNIITQQIQQSCNQSTQTNITPQSIQIIYLQKDIERKKQQIKALRDSKSFVEKNYIKTLQREKKTQIQLYNLKANNIMIQKSNFKNEDKSIELNQKIKHLKQQNQIQNQTLSNQYLQEKKNILKLKKQIYNRIQSQQKLFNNISTQTEPFQANNQQNLKEKIVQLQNIPKNNPLKKTILMIGKPMKIKNNNMAYSRQISIILNQQINFTKQNQIDRLSIIKNNKGEEKQYISIFRQSNEVRLQQKFLKSQKQQYQSKQQKSQNKQNQQKLQNKQSDQKSQNYQKSQKSQKEKQYKNIFQTKKQNFAEQKIIRKSFKQIKHNQKDQNYKLNKSYRLQNKKLQKTDNKYLNYKQTREGEQLNKSLKRNKKFYINKISRNSNNLVQDKKKVQKILQYMKSHKYYTQNSWNQQKKIQAQVLKNSFQNIIKSYKNINTQRQIYLHQQNQTGQVEDSKQILIQKIQNTKKIIQKQYSYFMAIGMIKFIDDIGLNIYKTLKSNGKIIKILQSKEKNVKAKDLQLFGGQKSAYNYQNQVGQWKQVNKNQQKLILDLKNTSFAQKINKFFILLEKIDKKQYQEYLLFLIYPTKFLYPQKKINQEQYKRIKSNKFLVKSTFLKILNYHKIYHKQCTHLIQFLYKIGFYKYIF